MQEIFLSNTFRRLWQGKDPFTEVERLEGQVYRHVKSRKTIRFSVNGQTYFAKIHRGIGWSEIVKDLSQLKLPILSAAHEWTALNLLHLIGIDTMSVAAYGRRGISPARLKSFIVTEELPQTRSLEEFCADWQMQPAPFRLRKALIERVAAIVREMHEHGMNHRDCYLCHFLLDVSDGCDPLDPDNLRLYVIDLHRAQVRRRTPRRWIVKDLAGLYFSAMNVGLTKTDRLRFIRAYRQESLRQVLGREPRFWRSVERAALALHRKHAEAS
ncbi:MAG: lipopolysaccharide core heptose(I) kinase RfaP [Sedimentisphaerales bacterium]|nr:lipopolysaccharide core heptose(I) kinase RfaP [Sedimentisphaerales bacterium]